MGQESSLAMTLYDRYFGIGGRRGDAVRAMGCMLAHHQHHVCWGSTVAAHALARETGNANGDSSDLFNACQGAYEEYGEYASSRRSQAAMKYELSPTLRAVEIRLELDASLGPEPCWSCMKTDGHTTTCSTAEPLRAEGGS